MKLTQVGLEHTSLHLDHPTNCATEAVDLIDQLKPFQSHQMHHRS